MVRLGHADLREGALAEVARQHERRDARDFGLVGQHLQIEHQLGVFVEGFGDADGGVGHFDLRRYLLFGALDAAFDFADVVQVFADDAAVALAEAGVAVGRLRG